MNVSVGPARVHLMVVEHAVADGREALGHPLLSLVRSLSFTETAMTLLRCIKEGILGRFRFSFHLLLSSSGRSFVIGGGSVVTPARICKRSLCCHVSVALP